MQDFKHHLNYFKLYLTWVDSALFQSPLLVSCAMVLLKTSPMILLQVLTMPTKLYCVLADTSSVKNLSY